MNIYDMNEYLESSETYIYQKLKEAEENAEDNGARYSSEEILSALKDAAEVLDAV